MPKFATGRQTMLFSSGRVRERACLHHVAERLRSLGAWARQELRGRGGVEAEEGGPAVLAGPGVVSLEELMSKLLTVQAALCDTDNAVVADG